MKTIQYITILLLVALSSAAQDRNVDWIHGLGGNATSWNSPTNPTAPNYAAARRILNWTNGAYPTNAGVAGMTGPVNNNTGGANSIAIGHSMGGVAARDIDINNNGHWNGIITLGSPLRGARIVNAVRDGEAQAFINSGTIQLMKGPGAGSILAGVNAINTVAGLLISGTATLGNIFSNQIAATVTNTLTNTLNLTVPTTNDLSPNGAYMTNPLLVNANTNTPKINIWGSESDPLLWRLAGTFGAGDDNIGVNTLNTIAGKYQALANAEYSMSWLMGNIGLGWAQSFYQWRGNRWKDGHDWLMYTSNDAWAQLIGASFTQTLSGYTPVSVCSEWYYYTYCDQVSDPDACRAQCWVWQPYTYSTYVKTESDGVVPASSQRNDGGAWRDNIVRAEGSINHQEHLRWDRIEPTLNRIFDGTNNYRNDVFALPRRP